MSYLNSNFEDNITYLKFDLKNTGILTILSFILKKILATFTYLKFDLQDNTNHLKSDLIDNVTYLKSDPVVVWVLVKELLVLYEQRQQNKLPVPCPCIWFQFDLAGSDMVGPQTLEQEHQDWILYGDCNFFP